MIAFNPVVSPFAINVRDAVEMQIITTFFFTYTTSVC